MCHLFALAHCDIEKYTFSLVKIIFSDVQLELTKTFYNIILIRKHQTLRFCTIFDWMYSFLVASGKNESRSRRQVNLKMKISKLELYHACIHEEKYSPVTHLYEISTSSKAQRIGEMFAVFVDAIMATEFFIIGAECDFVDTSIIDADTVVGEAFRGMEIEYE